MRTNWLWCLGVVSTAALAQNVVSPKAEPAEVGRYQMLAIQSALTLKLDSATGTSWQLCPSEKKVGTGFKWCQLSIKSTLPAGPPGRYQLLSEAAHPKQPNVFLLDSVSGRSWLLCSSPVPDKQPGWCSLEE
jgi:hypothetical protein